MRFRLQSKRMNFSIHQQLNCVTMRWCNATFKTEWSKLFFKSSKEYPLKFLELTEIERVYFFQVQNICTMHFLKYAKIFINFFAVKIQKSFFVQNFQFTFQTFSKWFSIFVFLLLKQKKLLLAGNESSSWLHVFW